MVTNSPSRHFSGCRPILLATAVLFAVAGTTAAPLQPGAKAPDFSLKAADGTVFRLADHVGRHNVVVVLLARKAAAEQAAFAKQLSAVSAAWAADSDARVVLVTTGKVSPAWAGSLQSPTLMVCSDPTAVVARRFRLATKSPPAVATFVVNKAGLIQNVRVAQSVAAAPTVQQIAGDLSQAPLHAVIEVGKPMPDFALPDQDGKMHRLADFKGKQKVVLAVYVKDMTPG